MRRTLGLVGRKASFAIFFVSLALSACAKSGDRNGSSAGTNGGSETQAEAKIGREAEPPQESPEPNPSDSRNQPSLSDSKDPANDPKSDSTGDPDSSPTRPSEEPSKGDVPLKGRVEPPRTSEAPPTGSNDVPPKGSEAPPRDAEAKDFQSQELRPDSRDRLKVPAAPPRSARERGGSEVSSRSAPGVRKLRILHIKLGGSGYFRVIRSELAKSLPGLENVSVEDLSPDLKGFNPFEISDRNFNLGDLRNSFEMAGPPHVYSENSLKWFARQVEIGRVPDLLVISGHHIPALGWHTDDLVVDDQNVDFNRGSLSSLQLFASAEKFPAVRQFFSKVKFAFIGGCWALANLEPHGPKGEYLQPSQIFVIYHHFMAGKWMMIGGPPFPHSLEHERDRLARLYDGDFTRMEKEEMCYRDKQQCSVLNLDRVLPDYGLYDGSHSFNGPLQFKKLFPAASLVMGFHSPSPEHRDVGELLAATLAGAKADLAIRGVTFDGHPVQSPLRMVFEENRLNPSSYREVIHALRVNWTKSTFLRNRGRASGSITPRFPDQDAWGPFAYYPGDKMILGAPRVAPYEQH